MPAKRALIMHQSDNVATAVEEIRAGDEVAVPMAGTTLELRATEPIPFGFKIALQDIPRGEIVRKYG
jgi:altronate dehydratase small subunit